MDRRHKLFFIAVLLLLLIIILRMALLAGNYGGKYRRDAQKISQKTGKLAAIRGRIYDQKDQLLVWSERCYDLVLQPGAVDDEIRKKIQLDLIRTVFFFLPHRTDKFQFHLIFIVPGNRY